LQRKYVVKKGVEKDMKKTILRNVFCIVLIVIVFITISNLTVAMQVYMENANTLNTSTNNQLDVALASSDDFILDEETLDVSDIQFHRGELTIDEADTDGVDATKVQITPTLDEQYIEFFQGTIALDPIIPSDSLTSDDININIESDSYAAESTLSSGFVTIVYRGNGHTSGTVPAHQTLTTPGSIALQPQGNLARIGHIFIGWRDSTGNILTAGGTIGWPTAVTGTLTLDAHWIPSIVTITYRGNGHTSGTVPTDQTLTTPGSIALRPQGGLARTGHVFVGWRDSAGSIMPAGGVIGWSTAVAGTLILDAHWIPSILTITYNGNSHSSGTVPGNQTLTTPGTITLRPQGNLAKTNYAFVGWIDNIGRIFPAGEPITVTNAVSGTLALDAHWVPSRVTITFIGNGHTTGTVPANQIITTPGNFMLPLQNHFGRAGHAFAGWMGPNGVLYHPGTILGYSSPVFGTVTFTAHWIAAGFPLEPHRHMNYWTPPAGSGTTNILLTSYYIDPNLNYYDWFIAMENGRNAWNNSPVSVSFSLGSIFDNQVLAAQTTDTTYLGYMRPLQLSGTSLNRFYIMMNGTTIPDFVANNNFNLSNVIQSVMAHEFAHTIGLRDGQQPQNGHPATLGGSDDASLMNANRDRNSITNPRPFDIETASIIYN
jgi:hypothetical protein